MIRPSLLLATSVALATGCGNQSPNDEAATAAIAEARQAFWDAHEAGDAEALTALVTDSAVLFAPGMEEVRGRDALRIAARQMFAMMSISDFNITTTELTVHGSMAYELATYSETMQIGDGDPTPVRGRYLLVWRREPDGAWRVERNMFHFITPAPF